MISHALLCFRLILLGEELSKEEKNLAIMAMKKKDKRLYDRIMHSKKKKRSEVNFFSDLFCIVQFKVRENHFCACMTCCATTLLYADMQVIHLFTRRKG